ncbi:CHAT domain-containing protein [Streptomyces sp. NPDC017988]|uniref:CHAT domain-containing protein n=1 Tax=Streptomyces sp. NPDC017988 TaxID=3365025 RepID=UPI0037873D21
MDLDAPLSDLYLLALRMADRSVAVDTALQVARDTAVDNLDDQTLSKAALACYNLVQSNPDHAYHFSHMVLALAEARGGRTRTSPWWTAADLFTEITRLSLEGSPRADRMLLALETASKQIAISRQALAQLTPRRSRFLRSRRADARREQDEAERERKELADTLQAAGWLLASPYCVSLDPEDMADSFAQWVAPYRLCGIVYRDAINGQRVSWPPDGTMPQRGTQIAGMPNVTSMLSTAMDFLNEALRIGPASLRTQCQVKRARVAALLTAAEPEIASRHWQVARSAIQDIGHIEVEPQDLEHHLEALALVARHHRLAPSLRLHTAIGAPARQLRTIYSSDANLRILANLCAVVHPADLPELWEEIHAVYSEADELSLSPRFWMHLAHQPVENVLSCLPRPLPYADLIPAVEAECDRLAVSSRSRAATLTHAALHVRADDVGQVIRLLHQIKQDDSGFASTYAAMIDWILLTCRKRHAKQCAAEGRHDEAIIQYLVSVETATEFASHHQRPAICTSLADQSLKALLESGTDGELGIRASALLAIAEPVMTGLGGALDERAGFVRGFGHHLMHTLLTWGWRDEHAAGEPRSLPALVTHHHLLFKGMDFRLLAQNAGPHQLPLYAGALHEEIAEQEKASGPYVPERSGALDGLFDMPGGTSGFCFVSEAEIGPEQQAKPSIGNNRRAVDHLINQSLLADTYQINGARARPGMTEVNNLFGSMTGEDTVVISLFLAEDRTRHLGPNGYATLLVCSQITDNEQTVRVVPLVDLPASHITMVDPQRANAFSIHWAAVPVGEAREGVNADPLGYPVSLHGEETLGRLYAGLGGPPAKMLQGWWTQGKRHLCFWPHGSLHFAPFHLLHTNGRPLADDWTVTTVSSSSQLSPQPSSAVAGPRRLLIAGSASGGIPYCLAHQPDVTEHVRTLRDHLDAEHAFDAVLLQQNATPKVVMAAASRSQYLHIAAHSSQDVEASWHQCLYLEPDEDGEGRLFAHQILTLDLRGVSLVTLSACESALGRYDANDNHRGLAAAFLLAGVTTVIGTLWPVTAPVTTLFFEELYSRLGAGCPKRQAFRRAQQKARQAFPEYRDWGAFVFIGHWR